MTAVLAPSAEPVTAVVGVSEGLPSEANYDCRRSGRRGRRRSAHRARRDLHRRAGGDAEWLADRAGQPAGGDGDPGADRHAGPDGDPVPDADAEADDSPDCGRAALRSSIMTAIG